MLRVVTYNIHSGKDLFWRSRLDEMADSLQETDAHIIGLQEVHQNDRMGYQLDYLAERLNYRYAYAPALPLFNGSFGNAVLTRLPLLHSECMPLYADHEPRVLLNCSLLMESRNIQLLVTHCSLRKKNRLVQLEQIRKMVHDKKDTPLLLLGDFNTAAPQMDQLLTDCATKGDRQKSATLTFVNKRLDFIFVSNHWRVLDYQVLPHRWSDHFPVQAILELA